MIDLFKYVLSTHYSQTTGRCRHWESSKKQGRKKWYTCGPDLLGSGWGVVTQERPRCSRGHEPQPSAEAEGLAWDSPSPSPRAASFLAMSVSGPILLAPCAGENLHCLLLLEIRHTWAQIQALPLTSSGASGATSAPSLRLSFCTCKTGLTACRAAGRTI